MPRPSDFPPGTLAVGVDGYNPNAILVSTGPHDVEGAVMTRRFRHPSFGRSHPLTVEHGVWAHQIQRAVDLDAG